MGISLLVVTQWFGSDSSNDRMKSSIDLYVRQNNLYCEGEDLKFYYEAYTSKQWLEMTVMTRCKDVMYQIQLN